MALSRVGRRPVDIPKGVTVTLQGRTVKVKGPKGTLEREIPAEVNVEIGPSAVAVSVDPASGRRGKERHGLVRALVQNMVTGVTRGYERKLSIVGTGYAFRLVDRTIGFKGLFAFDRPFRLPDLVQAELADKDTTLTLRSIDREILGRTAADLRAVAAPDRYKGKGIRFADEKVVLKARKGAKQA